MLTIFKRASIIDQFPPGFVDIHTHLLPNLDDGSKSMDESISIIKKLYHFGIKNIICTPHVMEGVWENSESMIQIKLQKLKTRLSQIGLDSINISAAAEYMLDDNFRKLLNQQKLLTFGSHNVLIELNYFNAPIDLYQLLFNLQVSGYKPVLAHPERYGYYHAHFKEYIRLKDTGCLFQLNLLSLTKYYGKIIQHTALKMLKENMYDFVGTDTHHISHLNYLEKIKGRKILKLVHPLLKNNASLV